MKTYQIMNKSYTSISVPVGDAKTIVIPKKGQSITVQFKEIPKQFLILQSNKVISIEEIS